MRPRLVCILLAAAVCAASAHGEERSALAVFDSAVATFESQRAALRQWQYEQTLTTQQFDESGKTVARGTWRYLARPGDPGPFEYLDEKTEGKLSFFKSGADEAGAVRKSTPAPQREEKNQSESALDAVRKYNLRDRYQWELLPDETVAGENAFVLHFQPKPGQASHSREERFFSLLAGKMWISHEDATILKAEGTLRAPCNLFWVIARVTAFEFTYKAEPVHGGDRLLRLNRATAYTVVTFPFYTVRQRHWLTTTRFEPRTPRRQ